MARSIQDIQEEIITAVQSDATLSGLTSSSAVAIWRLWTRVVAASLETEEQLNDLFREEMEQLGRDAITGTAEWLQKRVLEFQYSAASPQLVQVIDGVISYPVIDETLRIISRASVVSQDNGRVLVKAAKDDGLGGLSPLDSAEKNALSTYLDSVGFVGIPIDLTSQQADRVYLESFTLYYDGNYPAATIQTNLETAISNYLESVSLNTFDGVIVKNELIDAIQQADGVTSFGTPTISIRAFSETLSESKEIQIRRSSAAGYAILEDNTGDTLSDVITLLPDYQEPEV